MKGKNMKENKNFKLKSICHSCVSENPAECKSLLNIIPLDSRVKAENDREAGRSMVEMLGVLAVIGVLSVAGIAGYTNAMNKHRANELLNEASKRAVILAMQIAQGKTGTLSIDEFTNNKIGTAEFKNPTYTTGDKTFTMTLTGVDEAVCHQMKNTTGENGALKIDGTCGESLTLTFTKDLSGDRTNTEDTCEGEKCGAGCCTNGSTCDQETHTCCKEGLMGDGETVSKECCAPGMTPYQHDYMGIQCCEGKVLDNYCCDKGTTPYHHDSWGIQCCPEGNRIEAPGDGYEYCLAEGEYLFSRYGNDWMACPTSNFMSYDESKGITSGCCCSSSYDGEGVAVYYYYYEDIAGCICAPEGTKEAYNGEGGYVYCSKGVDKEYYRQNQTWRCLE